MIHLNVPPRKALPISVFDELARLAYHCPTPDWNFEEWLYGYLDLTAQATVPKLVQYIDTVKVEIQSQGFVVLELRRLLDDLDENNAASAVTVLLSCLGTPLRVFLAHPYWRRLSVDLNRPLASSGGIGDQPFHMDFVNAANPPDLVCLLSIRSDPLGGGASSIALFDRLEHELDLITREVLSYPLYRDGEVRNLNGVGHDVNPFPVFAPETRWAYRYTEKLIDSAPNDKARIALQAVSNILLSRGVSFTLSYGDLLILDQHRVVHGRQALGHGQHQVPENERRLLLQSFIRYEAKG
jgi:hypothetical protein